MKVLTIITSLLILETSASFLDEFRGAVSTVEDSFGKLLNDVIYDVKETIDCTLLAVEQALSLGMFGESDYDSRCKDAAAPVEQPAAAVETELALPPVQEITQKPIPILTDKENPPVGSSILDVDQVLCNVLSKDDVNSQLESVKSALRNETERLTEISDLLRNQLEELSNEVKQKFKAIELQTSEPSVESICNDIKILHEIEHRHKNTADARKISHILDQILDILDANEEDRTTEDDYKIQEIMRKLSKQTTDGSGNLWKDADDYPKDFREYAKKVVEESRGSSTTTTITTTAYLHPTAGHRPPLTRESSSSENDSEKPESNTSVKEKLEGDEKEEKSEEDQKKEKTSKNVEEEKSKKDDEKVKQKEVTTIKSKLMERRRTTTTSTTTEKPLTIEELAAQYGSLFDVIPNTNNIGNTAESAKNIIEDITVNEMVMKSLDELESNKDAQDLFDDETDSVIPPRNLKYKSLIVNGFYKFVGIPHDILIKHRSSNAHES